VLIAAEDCVVKETESGTLSIVREVDSVFIVSVIPPVMVCPVVLFPHPALAMYLVLRMSPFSICVEV
jgi:hypothetical protein